MGAYTVKVEGKEYDVDAPDEKTAWKWANAYHSKPVVASETKESPASIRNIAGAAIEPNLALLSGAVATPLAGLAGIAGALAPGPAGQGADWTRAVQNRLTYEPSTEGGKVATEAISYPFRKYGEGTEWVGGQVSDIAGPTAGAATKTALDIAPAAILSRFGKQTPQAETTLGKQGASMMQKAFKPYREDLASGDAQRAISTMLRERIQPTEAGMDTTRNLVRQLNNSVEARIAQSPETVNVARVGSYLQKPHQQAQTQVNPSTDVAAVRSVWDDFSRNAARGQTEIPAMRAHELKKGTYRQLGAKSYGEVGSMTTEAQKALARGLREETMSKVPGAMPALKREASLMNVLDVAEKRVLTQMNNNPTGLALLANNKSAFLAFLADRSAAFKGRLAQMLYDMGDPQAAQMAVQSGAQAQINPSDR